MNKELNENLQSSIKWLLENNEAPECILKSITSLLDTIVNFSNQGLENLKVLESVEKYLESQTGRNNQYYLLKKLINARLKEIQIFYQEHNFDDTNVDGDINNFLSGLEDGNI